MRVSPSRALAQVIHDSCLSRNCAIKMKKSKNYNSFFGKYVSANMYNIAAGPKSFKFQSLKSADTNPYAQEWYWFQHRCAGSCCYIQENR